LIEQQSNVDNGLGASQFLLFDEIIKINMSLRSRSSLRDAQRERVDGKLLDFAFIGMLPNGFLFEQFFTKYWIKQVAWQLIPII
jgi:hypothetical protein